MTKADSCTAVGLHYNNEDGKIQMINKLKQYISADKCMKAMVIVSVWLIFIYAAMSVFDYSEVDSYMLPSISLQYRHSMIITQEDILQAKEDFPDIYKNVNSYDDLRASRLVKIDEEHWLPYYFPLFAILSMPIKLLLAFMHLDQQKCFALTAALFLSIGIIMVYKNALQKDRRQFWIIPMLLISPIWLYIRYISAEALMCGLILTALVFWDRERYRPAALIISITCTMNPTIMGIGIVLFIEQFIKELSKDNKFLLKKDGLVRQLLLCACYIPSLVPFAINKYYTGKWNLTMMSPVKITGDSLPQRALEYFFDLNLGAASFALLTVLLFFAAFVYSAAKKKLHLCMLCISGIFTVLLFSYHMHINCGMRYCARYVIWIYPVLIFAVTDFLLALPDRKKLVHTVINVCCTANSVIFIGINGLLYNRLELSSVSEFVLNNFPSLYVSFCESTFSSRTHHADGAYNLESFGGYSVYCDSRSGEIRKLLYVSDPQTKAMLDASIISDNGTNIADILDSSDNGSHKWLSVSPSAKTQYRIDELNVSVIGIFKEHNIPYDTETVNNISRGIREGDRSVTDSLYDILTDGLTDEQDMISEFYRCLLKRSITPYESDLQKNRLESGSATVYQIYNEFFGCTEFARIYDMEKAQ